MMDDLDLGSPSNMVTGNMTVASLVHSFDNRWHFVYYLMFETVSPPSVNL